jgi:DNA-binding HxlR family transcriptional regulator
VDYALTQVGETLSIEVSSLIRWAEQHREYVGKSRLRYDDGLTASPRPTV